MTHPGGRPKKYDPSSLLEKWYEYVKDCESREKFANIAGFSVFADIHRDSVYEYFSQAEYSDTKKKIEGMIEDISIQCGITAKNPAFPIFYMKNKCGYRDKAEVEINPDSDGVIKVSFVKSDE